MLKVCEMFYSIQGESTYAGLPCFFIRLAGCNLICNHCDTVYACETVTAESLTPDEITTRALAVSVPLVEITGGEPLLQNEVHQLIGGLLRAGKQVLLETNGSRDISLVDERVTVIMDVKTPSSGMSASFLKSNLTNLRPHHQVKFVIYDESDYQWSSDFLRDRLLDFPGEVLFGPVAGGLAPGKLADLILADHLPVRLQLQLQRILWPEISRGK